MALPLQEEAGCSGESLLAMATGNELAAEIARTLFEPTPQRREPPDELELLALAHS